MPNEGSMWMRSANLGRSGVMPLPRRYLSEAVVLSPPVHRGLISVVSADELPMFRGRLLYTPLYSGSFSGFACQGIANPGGRSRGLGDEFGALFEVGSAIASGATKFMEIIGSIASAVADILSQIVDFIVKGVMKIVSAVLSAVSGLLGAVLDAVGLKGDGSLDPSKAIALAALLQGKKDSLSGQQNGANRPMTPEEKAGYQRNLDDAQSGIYDLSGSAAKIVAAIGGPVGAVAIGAGIAGMILLSKRKR